MNSDQIQSYVRGFLIAAGAGLVSHHLIDNVQLNNLVGALMVIGPILWSAYQKREAAKLAKAVVTVNAAVRNGDATHVDDAGSLSGKTVVVTPSVG